MALLDSYPTTYSDSFNALAFNYVKTGQSVRLSQRATISSVKFLLAKLGSPTGNITASIFNHTGVYGGGGTGYGSALDTSDTVDIATVPTSPESLFEFTFSSPITIDANIPYVVGVEHGSGDSTNYLKVFQQFTPSPGHSGQVCRYSSVGVWETTDKDTIFYLYGDYIRPSITGIQSVTGIQSITF